EYIQVPGSGEIIGRCGPPAGLAAGCEHLRIERIRTLAECVQVLLQTEQGDTLNYNDQ
ncbi:unnamed protein product, partial [Polarella glacialis]